MANLILIRHGESQWNLENRFTGWVDVPLSPKGEQEARAAGEKLKTYKFDEAFCSYFNGRREPCRLLWKSAAIRRSQRNLTRP